MVETAVGSVRGRRGVLPPHGAEVLVPVALELFALMRIEDLCDAIERLVDGRHHPRRHLVPDRRHLAVAVGEDGVDLTLLIGVEIEAPPKLFGGAPPAEAAQATTSRRMGAVMQEQVAPQHADQDADQEQRQHTGKRGGPFQGQTSGGCADQASIWSVLGASSSSRGEIA